MNWIKDKLKKFRTWFIFGFLGVGIAFAATQIPIPEANGITLENSTVIVWDKPTTDQQWADDVKKESLDLKFGYQLTDMKLSLENKLPFHEKDLDKITRCPDCIRWELEENFKQMFDNAEIAYNKQLEGKTLQEWIDGEFIEQTTNTTWEVEKVRQSIERIDNEIRLRDKGFVTVIDTIPAGDSRRLNLGNTRSPLGTVFYIDADCATPGNGSTPTCDNDANDPFDDILDFTETGRSGGDIAILRRGTTNLYDDGTDLLFTSDGTIGNPITIEADYDNIVWSGGADFANSAQTYTPVFGSKTMEASASITGISVGDWVYNSTDSDDNREFSYEVKSVSGTTLTLYLPWKGSTGSGKTLVIMPKVPQWNTAAGNFQWNFDNDNHWKIQGIYILGTDFNGQVEVDSSVDSHLFKDIIFEGNGSSDIGVNNSDDTFEITILKSRFFNSQDAIKTAFESGIMVLRDILIDLNSINSADGIDIGWGVQLSANAIEFDGVDGTSATVFEMNEQNTFKIRNFNLTGTITSVFQNNNSDAGINVFIEDYNNVIGDNRQFLGLIDTDGDLMIKSTSTASLLRSGGGATSIQVEPSTNISTNWEESRLKLFEYPIYTDTTSRDYDIYFRTEATADWTSDPTNSELWIECEYWGHASNNFRKITKSTGVIDFNGSTSWQALSVTCASAQEGILYLKGWYAKTKETPSNIFFVDIQPVITDT